MQFCTIPQPSSMCLCPSGDPGLAGRAVLTAAGGGHVGGAVAEALQVPRDEHCHCLWAAWLLRAGRWTHRNLTSTPRHFPFERVNTNRHCFPHGRPKRVMRRPWKKPVRSTRGTTRLLPSSLSTSYGRITGSGRFHGLFKSMEADPS